MGVLARNLGSIIVDELRHEFIDDALQSIGKKASLLDLGCGVRPFRHLYDRFVGHSVGVDAPFSLHDMGAIDVHALGNALPFRDGAFDIVLCTEVLEHVPDPGKVLREIFRVLKHDGSLIMTTPFLVPLHEDPYDFYRYTTYGLKYLCHEHGFHIDRLIPFSGLSGVTISFLVQVQLKFWYGVWRATKLPGVYTVFNPFIFMFVYLPQKAYLLFLRLAGRIPVLQAVHRKLTYTTKGYGLLAFKK
jgi:SAM-dependent methyltransferase